jgi:hypothetical protein
VVLNTVTTTLYLLFQYVKRGGRDHMVVEFITLPMLSVPITKVVSSNPVHSEVYMIQHYVIKFVSDLRQVDVFLRVIRFSPPLKLTATI